MPLRQLRPFGLTVELGVNTPAGVGLAFSYAPIDHLNLAVAGGWNFRGPRIAAMARAELSKAAATPYAGLGLAFDFGVQRRDDRFPEPLAVKQTLSLLVAGGVSWVTPSGFQLTTTAGYAFAVYQKNRFNPSDPVNARNTVTDLFAGSAPIFGVGLGSAF